VIKEHVTVRPCDAGCPHFSAKIYNIVSKSASSYKNFIEVSNLNIGQFVVVLEHIESTSRDFHFTNLEREDQVRKALHREGQPALRVQIL
jgi:hypothetical protein